MSDSVVKRFDPDDASAEYSQNKKSATWTVKAGLAQMLKGACVTTNDDRHECSSKIRAKAYVSRLWRWQRDYVRHPPGCLYGCPLCVAWRLRTLIA